MYKIGITGSIGCGKTTIAKIFALFNIPIFDADNEIKKILDDKAIKGKIKKIWPIVFNKGYFDKTQLRSIIFSNKDDKIKLEKILYPKLEIIKQNFEKSNSKKKVVAYDVPLIYETKSEKKYNFIILAYCSEEVQKQRVLTRDNISEKLFKKITKSQLNFKEKIKFKPMVVNTDKLKVFIFLRIAILLVKITYGLKVNK